MGWLDGKRALVVGAGSGIGRAVLDAFAAEGAAIAALELDPAKCARLAADLPACVVSQGDSTLAVGAAAAVAATVDGLGGLDVLVNCVGIFDFYRALTELSPAELDQGFDELFRANVLSHLVSAQAAIPALRASGAGAGSIILTVSTSGFYPGRGGILYVASKFAVRGCVTALAHELAPEIRVNGVAPGGTLGTELTGPSALGLSDRVLDGPDRAADLRARTPLQIALTGADHAGSYVFLASDRSRGTTGTILHTGGGASLR
jgi:NAD(P)-dependent dehydrogenase (short-subunit alcohol dehydrogenase family)